MGFSVKHAVRKAVIPAGGLGTRMHPLTRGIPKEMLPVGGRPMIRWCIEEALLSGIRQIGIVLNSEKRCIRDYLTSPETIGYHENDSVFWETLQRCVLRFIEQPAPRGSGDALCRSRSFVGDEPFAVMMPDFILFDSRPALRQMIEAVEERQGSAVAFLRLDQRKARTFGNVGVLETEEIEDPVHRIITLSDKRPGTLILKRETRVSKAVGRQILHPDFFEAFDGISWDGTKELDDVPVIQRLIEEEGVFGICLQGCGFDVGNHEGYRAANEYLKRQAHSLA